MKITINVVIFNFILVLCKTGVKTGKDPPLFSILFGVSKAMIAGGGVSVMIGM